MARLANIRRFEDWHEQRFVYIDRRSNWGNPFHIGVDGTRAEVIAKYKEWITKGPGRPMLKRLHELRGKVLLCWCYPLACHGSVLIELLIERWPEEREDDVTFPA